MKIIPFFQRGYESNSYLVVDGKHAALIDAGVSEDNLLDALKAEEAELSYILLTHGHFDHTLSADALRKQTGARLCIHQLDDEMLKDAQKSALALFFGKYDTVGESDLQLLDGDEIELESVKLKVIHTPGHSKGSVCYLTGDVMFTGDTLFDGGYGRFDLHGGDPKALGSSLYSLSSFDKDITVYPGHGGAARLESALNKINII